MSKQEAADYREPDDLTDEEAELIAQATKQTQDEVGQAWFRQEGRCKACQNVVAVEDATVTFPGNGGPSIMTCKRDECVNTVLWGLMRMCARANGRGGFRRVG